MRRALDKQLPGPAWKGIALSRACVTMVAGGAGWGEGGLHGDVIPDAHN